MRVLATKVVAKVYDLIVKGGFWPQTDPEVDVRDAPFLRFKGRVVSARRKLKRTKVTQLFESEERTI